MYLIGFYSKKNISKLSRFEYYRNCFLTLKKQGINIIYFYKEDTSVDIQKEILDDIKSIGVNIISFKDKEEIISYLKKIQGKIFINTFEEQEILFVNDIRKALGQKITINPELFLNKFLQRDIIGKKYPETMVQYKLFSIEEAKIVKEENLPSLPFIIKPTGGVQSSGVGKVEDIKNYKEILNTTLTAFKKLEDKNLINQQILIEEFIDGKMYTIDYYVDEKQNIKVSKPVGVKIGFDYGIKDFCNISRFISKEIEKEVDEEKLKEFIKKTVLGGEIRNTFIHHEFKITSKGEFKTIETNGRIGGYRIDMYQVGYEINLLKFPFIKEEKEHTIQKNIAMFALYPNKEGLFNGFNENLLKKIERLPSFHRINRGIKTIGTPLGLTKDGYSKAGGIELANKDFDQFKKDVKFIEENYFNIINMKE